VALGTTLSAMLWPVNTENAKTCGALPLASVAKVTKDLWEAHGFLHSMQLMTFCW
jgi:hypothetical protein